VRDRESVSEREMQLEKERERVGEGVRETGEEDQKDRT
jgi:hypothetical protein